MFFHDFNSGLLTKIGIENCCDTVLVADKLELKLVVFSSLSEELWMYVAQRLRVREWNFIHQAPRLTKSKQLSGMHVRLTKR